MDELDEILTELWDKAWDVAYDDTTKKAPEAVAEAKSKFQAEVLKARITQAEEATQHRTYTFQPVGGLSNIEYVALGDLKRDLARLQAQASKQEEKS